MKRGALPGAARQGVIHNLIGCKRNGERPTVSLERPVTWCPAHTLSLSTSFRDV